MDFLNCSVQQWLDNETEYLKIIRRDENWDQIPLFNANEQHSFKDGALVRFRGMVQDMHGPEYYLEKFEVVHETEGKKYLKSGKYCDFAISGENEEVNLDSNRNVTSERQKYVVISTPGINEWVEHLEYQKYVIKSPEIDSSSFKKRPLEDDDMETDETTSNVNECPKKSSLGKQPTDNSVAISQEHVLNFPIPGSRGKTCHVRLYSDSENVKLNDVFEFAGFLSMNPFIESIYDRDDIENQMEIQTHHPPSSLVPSIHAVHFRKMLHNNPLVTNQASLDSSQMNLIKKNLLVVLSQLLMGDTLAAEYLICHLISEIYSRRHCMPLGKFTLNISQVPVFQHNNYVPEVYTFLEMLVPKSLYLAMTLENMNNLSFIPKKDYECNRLTSGLLQLSKNTMVVLDETKLMEGKLNASGIHSVKAIAEAIKNQRVIYDFNFYPLEYDCDIPFLIFSEGKSMLPCDYQIVLTPEESCLNTFPEILEAARHFLKPDVLNDIRTYLTRARLAEYEISGGVEELIQEEFVQMRQEGAVTADDLHHLLVLARLICLSEGKNTLDNECWKKACQLEKLRKSRLKK
ncbi:mini-chromosome maintenance complex-binding protein [Cylas formicarius]|uniref:mini-chromosome maintenance complex-binding protein n=1 Tax=Cylas formicarius TaxID=197179 RepID=UPI00295855BB|nr:mini-chromosome maintenance complex-binding protein [Cylas formicarius]